MTAMMPALAVSTLLQDRATASARCADAGGRRGDGRRRDVEARSAQHRQVGRRIPAGQLGFDRAAIGRADAQAVLASERAHGRQDHISGIHDAAGRLAPAVHLNHRGRRSGHGVGQVVRECDESRLAHAGDSASAGRPVTSPGWARTVRGAKCEVLRSCWVHLASAPRTPHRLFERRRGIDLHRAAGRHVGGRDGDEEQRGRDDHVRHRIGGADGKELRSNGRRERQTEPDAEGDADDRELQRLPHHQGQHLRRRRAEGQADADFRRAFRGDERDDAVDADARRAASAIAPNSATSINTKRRSATELLRICDIVRTSNGGSAPDVADRLPDGRRERGRVAGRREWRETAAPARFCR